MRPGSVLAQLTLASHSALKRATEDAAGRAMFVNILVAIDSSPFAPRARAGDDMARAMNSKLTLISSRGSQRGGASVAAGACLAQTLNITGGA